VEFAKQRQEAGVPRWEATLEACRLRLRPIIMTSFAFIFGVLPLVIAEGAGAEMRRSLGTAVFAGMIGVTVFGIFLTPASYYVLQWFGRKTVVVPQSAIVQAPPLGELASSDQFWQASVQQVEDALKALRQVPEDGDALRRATDALQIALTKLHEQP